MRPARKVLVLSADEVRLSVVTVVLATKLYAVTGCCALASLPDPRGFDAALVIESGGGCLTEAMVVALKARAPELPVVLVRTETLGEPTLADRVVLYEMPAVLETLRLAVARKRGPKPNPVPLHLRAGRRRQASAGTVA